MCHLDLWDYIGDAMGLLQHMDDLFDTVLQRVMEEPVLLGKSERTMKSSLKNERIRSKHIFASTEAFGEQVLGAKTASSMSQP